MNEPRRQRRTKWREEQDNKRRHRSSSYYVFYYYIFPVSKKSSINGFLPRHLGLEIIIRKLEASFANNAKSETSTLHTLLTK